MLQLLNLNNYHLYYYNSTDVLEFHYKIILSTTIRFYLILSVEFRTGSRVCELKKNRKCPLRMCSLHFYTVI